MTPNIFYLGGSVVLTILVAVDPPAVFVLPRIALVVTALVTCVALILNMVMGKFWTGEIAAAGAWVIALTRSIEIAQSDLSLISVFLWVLWALAVTLFVTRTQK